MTDDIKRFCEIINGSDNVVFFGGAGVSTESGIKDFRSVDGLYNEKYKYPPEEILSRTFFFNNTEEFYRFYRDKLLIEGVKPNVTHYALAELEKRGKLKAVVTQNIDDLHEAAGSKNVFHLHGGIDRYFCLNCRKKYDLDYVKSVSGVPHCSCGGILKPDVVLYEETLDDATVKGAVEYISEADVLIVGGTSLVVYPAAGLIEYYGGNKLILINKQPTPYDRYADLVINKGLGEVFGALGLTD
ncbi:MAG: NAD-dependent protein deacylase [Clostridia bacterium]|nr:NAD-dependent protein deacylase [Clostridia bacterium]